MPLKTIQTHVDTTKKNIKKKYFSNILKFFDSEKKRVHKNAQEQ